MAFILCNGMVLDDRGDALVNLRYYKRQIYFSLSSLINFLKVQQFKEEIMLKQSWMNIKLEHC